MTARSKIIKKINHSLPDNLDILITYVTTVTINNFFLSMTRLDWACYRKERYIQPDTAADYTLPQNKPAAAVEFYQQKMWSWYKRQLSNT